MPFRNTMTLSDFNSIAICAAKYIGALGRELKMAKNALMEKDKTIQEADKCIEELKARITELERMNQELEFEKKNEL
jgi:hypothetical protein